MSDDPVDDRLVQLLPLFHLFSYAFLQFINISDDFSYSITILMWYNLLKKEQLGMVMTALIFV